MGVYRDELNQRKDELQRRLDSITKAKRKDVAWRPGVLDQAHSESYVLESYTDDKEAMRLKREINEINEQISNIGYDPTEAEIEASNRKREYESWVSDGKKVESISKELYQKELEEYRSKKFFDRLFSHKKPIKISKKDSNRQRNSKIVEAYGEEAIEKILVDGNAYNNIDFKKQGEIQYAKARYADNPERLAQELEKIEKKYEDVVEDLKNNYRKHVDRMVEEGKTTGRGGRR